VTNTVIFITCCKLPLSIKRFLLEETSTAIVVFEIEISQLERTVLLVIHSPFSVTYLTHRAVIPSVVVLLVFVFVLLCYVLGQPQFVKILSTLMTVTTFPIWLISMALVR